MPGLRVFDKFGNIEDQHDFAFAGNRGAGNALDTIQIFPNRLDDDFLLRPQFVYDDADAPIAERGDDDIEPVPLMVLISDLDMRTASMTELKGMAKVARSTSTISA